MTMGMFDEEELQIILEETKINLSPKKQKELYKKLKNIYKEFRIWGLNGYKITELTSKYNKSTKIGRNELCP